MINAKPKVLLAPLRATLGVVNLRHAQPILSNALIEFLDGHLICTGTDGELTVSSVTSIAGLETAEPVLAPAQKLAALLSRLPDSSPVSIEPNGTKLQIKSGRNRFSLPTMPADTFPRMPLGGEPLVQLHIPERQLRIMLGRIAPAMLAPQTKDSRYYLRGALFEILAGQLQITAADGVRGAQERYQLRDTSASCQAIVPYKAIVELLSLLGAEPVHIQLFERRAVFTWPGVTMISSLIDGRYPKFRSLQTAEFKTTVLVETAKLREALGLAQLFTAKLQGVRLIVDGGQTMRVEVQTKDEDSVQLVDIKACTGEVVDMDFDVRYMISMVETCNTPELALNFAPTGEYAGMLRATIPGGDDAYQHIVMAMRV